MNSIFGGLHPFERVHYNLAAPKNLKLRARKKIKILNWTIRKKRRGRNWQTEVFQSPKAREDANQFYRIIKFVKKHSCHGVSGSEPALPGPRMSKFFILLNKLIHAEIRQEL